MADFSLTILGSGSAVPMHGRHPSAQVLQHKDSFFLIDCGEGTQFRFADFKIKSFRIQVIFISHLHGDHVFGLPGLLSSYSLLGRTTPLTIYGPKGLQELLETIFHYSALRIQFPLEITEIESNGLKRIMETEDLEVLTFPLLHRIRCQGYLFREKKAQIHLNKTTLASKPFTADQIKAALRGEEIVAGTENISPEDFFLPAAPLMSYAYCSDTAYSELVAKLLKGVGVLYHEATFRHELAELATTTGHSTAGEAAKIAAAAGAKCLLLGHYSSRYKVLDDLLMEARTIFPNSHLTAEGINYPLRELCHSVSS